MLSYKFTKENIFYPEQMVDRDGEDYQSQLKSLQDTMKSIREMDERDREVVASSGWDQKALKASFARSSAKKSTKSKRQGKTRNNANKHTASVDSIDYELSSSDEE